MNYRNLKQALNTDVIDDAVRRDVLAHTRDYVSDLIDVLPDENQWGADEDADGRAAIHAATLLGELRITDAIVPMLDVLDEVEMDGELATVIVDALCAMGRATMEPVLRRYRDREGTEVQFGHLEILARCGVKDDRIAEVLCRELESDTAFGATLLRLYGDAHALGDLQHALDGVTIKPGKEEALRAVDVMELCTAIEALGGTVTKEQDHKRAAAIKVLDALPEDGADDDDMPSAPPTAPAPFAFKRKPDGEGHVHSASCGHAHQVPHKRTREKIGPNEPCHCGSGKKYKKCHLFEDERARFSVV